MVAIVIIGLVIAVWWFSASAHEAKIELTQEKGKIYNFSELITLIKNSDSDYQERYLNSNHIDLTKQTLRGFKKFSISTSDGVLSISFILKISSKTEYKSFRFTIYDSPQIVAQTILSEAIATEEKFLNENPSFRIIMLKPHP